MKVETIVSFVLIISFLVSVFPMSNFSVNLGWGSGTSGLYSFPDMASNGRSFGVSARISDVYSGGYAMVGTDAVGGVYVTWYSLDTLELFFTYSHDDGKTWSLVTRLCGGGNPLVGCSDPDVAVDRQNGHVYVDWIDNRTGHTNVYIRRSVDRGVSFGPAITVNDVEGSDIVSVDNGVSYSTHVTVANDGTVYVAWEDNRTNPSYSDIYLAKSTDHGQTFGTNIRVNPYEAAASYRVPWIAVDEAGVVYIAYTKINFTIQSVFLTRSLDGGLSFKAPVKINDDSLDCYRGKKEIGISKDGKINVVWTDARNLSTRSWDIYFATSLDGGLSFGPNVRVNDDRGQAIQGTPSLAIDSMGAIHVVWEDFRNNGVAPTYFRDVYYAFSEDGKRFSENVKVNYVPDATAVDCADPNIAIDSHDDLYIVFSDAPHNDTDLGIYFAYSAGWTWPMFHHDPSHTGTSTSAGPTTNNLLWTYQTSYSVQTSSPAVVGGLVYVGSWDDDFYCLNAATGALIWRSRGGAYCSPAVVGGLVYVGSDYYDKSVYCLNAATGALVWNYTTGNWVISSPAVVGGLVYVGSDDHNVYCLNASTGAFVWRYTTGNEVESSPAVAGGLVYVGSVDGNVYCLNASTGALVWNHMIGDLVGFSSPAVVGGLVYVGSDDIVGSNSGGIYCLNAATGALVWNYTTGNWVQSSPAVAGGLVYVGSLDHNLYCLNASTGAFVWRYTTGNEVESSPAVAGGLVYVGSVDGNVYCLNASTGALVWNYTTGGGVWSSPAVVNGVVYVGSDDGEIYAFGPAFAALVVRGQDNRIYYRIYSSSTASWGGWNSLPTGTTMDGPAAAVCTDILYVVVRGSDDTSLWFSSVNLTDSSFSGWNLLSGSTPSAPTLSSNGTTLALTVRGEDNRIYYRFFTIASQTWTGWSVLPSGATLDSPAASLVGNGLHVVVRGMDGSSLWYSNVNQTTGVFSGWTLLSGSTPSTPTLSSNSTALALVVRGEDNRIYYRFYTLATQTWTGWTALPSGTTLDSPAATILENTLYIVVRGSDGTSLWQSSIDLGTSTFSGWTLLSGSTPSKPTLTS